MTWTHGEKALDAFVQGLHNLKPRIKFTLESSITSITFLDLRIFKGPRFTSCRKLDTEIHYKVTNNFTYVHGNSHHPPHVYKAVAMGETLRILRNCSAEDTFATHKRNLLLRLKQRGFPRSALRRARAVNFADRQKALEGTFTTSAETDKEKPSLFYITKYARTKPSLTSTLSKHWLAIESDPHLSRTYKTPPMVSYTNSKPLRSILRKVNFEHPRLIPPDMPPPSPFPMLRLTRPNYPVNRCNNRRCEVCLRRLHHTVVRNRKNILFPIDPTLTCTSTNILYVLQCTHCAKQYVGQTSYSMRHRLAGHTYAFGRNHKSLYYHFIKIHKSNFEINIILLQQVTDHKLRLVAENEWIEKLDTLLPRGLNTRSNINVSPDR